MNRRDRRKLLVASVIGMVGLATFLGFQAFEENMMYFYSPTDLQAGKAPESRMIRVGGLVVDGSVEREEGSLAVRFDLTDNKENITVAYEGILPDLFREGQGIVALGKVDGSGDFVADEVLAKHDENYMPPEVADALKAAEMPPHNDGT